MKKGTACLLALLALPTAPALSDNAVQQVQTCSGFGGELDGPVFRPDSAALDETAMAVLATAVKTFKHQWPLARITLEGHTDSDGPALYNQALSLRRAEGVKTFLIEHGITPRRISTLGRGESRPIADNSKPEGKARNRRVNIVFEQVEHCGPTQGHQLLLRPY